MASHPARKEFVKNWTAGYPAEVGPMRAELDALIAAEVGELVEALHSRALVAHAASRKLARLEGQESDHQGAFEICPAASCVEARALIAKHGGAK